MFECVALSYEAGNFWCEVGVVVSSVASWNVVFVCIEYYVVEVYYMLVNIGNRYVV